MSYAKELRDSLQRLVHGLESIVTFKAPTFEEVLEFKSRLDAAKELLARPEPETKSIDEVAAVLEIEDDGGNITQRSAQWIRLESGYWAMRIKLEPSPRITREEAAKLLFARDIALKNFLFSDLPSDDQMKALDDANSALFAAMGVER